MSSLRDLRWEVPVFHFPFGGGASDLLKTDGKTPGRAQPEPGLAGGEHAPAPLSDRQDGWICQRVTSATRWPGPSSPVVARSTASRCTANFAPCTWSASTTTSTRQ